MNKDDKFDPEVCRKKRKKASVSPKNYTSKSRHSVSISIFEDKPKTESKKVNSKKVAERKSASKSRRTVMPSSRKFLETE